MKLSKLLFATSTLFFCSPLLLAQVQVLSAGGGFDPNPERIPCLTSEQRATYQEEVANNIALLEAEGTLLPVTEGGGLLFSWPVAQADGFDYNSSWSISNYVDHNPASGTLEDYNCGTRTYDTSSGYDHQGLDIFTWPFTWKQVDEEQTNVVAAAAGQIIFKRDGEYDRNCSFNSDPWNAVYVRHADGSVAWYGHMKNGSLTSKGVGDLVSEGEYLGVIASSGNSTGPHLHFEVYDLTPSLIDPYAGPCNDLNSTSWWQSQKPYINPQINAVLTHTDIPDFGSCPDTEITYESTDFEPNDSAWFGSYFKDQQPGTASQNRIYDPSGDLYFSWTRNFSVFYYASWWLQNVTLSAEEGTWIYEVEYNGETVQHEFTVNTLGVEDNQINTVIMAPNPAVNSVRIQSEQPLTGVSIYDINGRLLKQLDVSGNTLELDLTSLQSGMYFVRVIAENNSIQSLRLLKR